jgi:hypothetical protein
MKNIISIKCWGIPYGETSKGGTGEMTIQMDCSSIKEFKKEAKKQGIKLTGKPYTKLDLANAGFLAFKEGKKFLPHLPWNRDEIINLAKRNSLTKKEWNEWKKNYPNILDDKDFQALENYFENRK